MAYKLSNSDLEARRTGSTLLARMTHESGVTRESVAPAGTQGGVVMFSGVKFMLGSAAAAIGMLVLGRVISIPVWLIALEVGVTILALFLLGSFKYQLHKNALTYGAALVIAATFMGAWWTKNQQKGAFTSEEMQAWWPTFKQYFLTFHGLDELIHADTMLFILGLTLFVSVIAQTRLLEDVTFLLLRRSKGHVLPTMIALLALVGFSSGILGGVSMIGLTIRTLAIILLLAQAKPAAISFSIMVCTLVTTVCGTWLAYGEPPNLIMKANLVSPDGSYLLNDAFFLRYCLPVSIVSFICVAFSLRRHMGGLRVDLDKLDVLDANVATVRFLQASRHGEVLTPIEFVEDHEAQLSGRFKEVLACVREGQPLGAALVRCGVPEPVRYELLGRYVDEDLAVKLDKHYQIEAAGKNRGEDVGEAAVHKAIEALHRRRNWARLAGGLALMPFIGLLILHGANNDVPLFLSPFAGFAVALLGIYAIPKMRRLALHEAKLEYAEYYFLFPLFLSVTLLTKIGFFDGMQQLLKQGIASSGAIAMALAQFAGATVLSAILDNNVVADFASRALQNLPVAVLRLFSMAQIAGYAAGGCWTHIGSAQSIVAFAFIRRNTDPNYSPVQWMKAMTGTLLTVAAALMVLICVEAIIFG